MALRPIYTQPAPTLPAWATEPSSLRDFNTSLTPAQKSLQSGTLEPRATGFNWNKATSTIKGLIPFASNIANQFRRAPNPPVPGMVSPVTLNRVNYSNERSNIDSMVRGADIGAERSLDGNTSEAVQAANLATKLRVYGDSYAKENNQNAAIGNQQEMINADINERNTRAKDQYNYNVLEQNIAQQRERSGNLANAADKFIALENEKGQRQADIDVASIYGRTTQDVQGRLLEYAKSKGISLAKALEEAGQRRFGGSLKKVF